MKQDQKTSLDAQNSGTWAAPAGRPDASLNNRTAEDITEWASLTAQVAQVSAEQGWTQADVARRMDMPGSTFSQWYNGGYSGRLGNLNAKAKSWLAGVAAMAELAAAIPQKPPFQMLKMAQEIISTLTLAQAMGDMVIITVAAGNGKTEAARHYRAARANVCLITASPQTRGVSGTLQNLAAELGLEESRASRLPRRIGLALERLGGSLIIVDEAQNLTDEAVNQLRYFSDNFGAGVALMGNDEVYTRVERSAGRNSAQIKSRVAKRLNRAKPYLRDLQARIAAWGITDPEAAEYLEGIGLKAGALRQIDKTMTLAGMAAAGAGAALDKSHIKAAWENRDVGELAL